MPTSKRVRTSLLPAERSPHRAADRCVSHRAGDRTAAGEVSAEHVAVGRPVGIEHRCVVERPERQLVRGLHGRGIAHRETFLTRDDRYAASECEGNRHEADERQHTVRLAHPAFGPEPRAASALAAALDEVGGSAIRRVATRSPEDSRSIRVRAVSRPHCLGSEGGR